MHPFIENQQIQHPVMQIQQMYDKFIESNNYSSTSAGKIASIFAKHKKEINSISDRSILSAIFSEMKAKIETREGTSQSYIGKLYRYLYRAASALFNGFTSGCFYSSHIIVEELLNQVSNKND